jgi:hypothetical protein
MGEDRVKIDGEMMTKKWELATGEEEIHQNFYTQSWM